MDSSLGISVPAGKRSSLGWAFHPLCRLEYQFGESSQITREAGPQFQATRILWLTTTQHQDQPQSQQECQTPTSSSVLSFIHFRTRLPFAPSHEDWEVFAEDYCQELACVCVCGGVHPCMYSWRTGEDIVYPVLSLYLISLIPGPSLNLELG